MKSNIKKIVLFIISITILCMLFGSWWILRMKHYAPREEYIISNANKMKFEAPFREIHRFGFSINDNDLEQKTNGNIITSLDITINDSTGNEVWKHHYDNVVIDFFKITVCKDVENMPVCLDKGKIYTINCVAKDISSEAITVVLFGTQSSVLNIYVLVVFLFVMVCVAAIWGLTRTKDDKQAINRFVFIYAVLGIMFTLIIPPFSVQDEPSHFARAYELSNEWLKMDAVDEYGNVYLYQEGFSLMEWGYHPQELYRFWKNFEYGSNTCKITNSRYPYNTALKQYVYVLPAIGITLARILKLPYQIVCLSGALVNGIIFLILIYLSLRILPRYRESFEGILLFPSIIWMMFSYSYDVWNMGFATLFVAYIIRMKYSDKIIGFKDWFILFLIMLSLMPVKFLYFGLAFGIIIIHSEKFKNKVWQFGTYLFTIATSIAISMLARGRSAINYATTSELDPRTLNYQTVGANGQTVVEVLERQSISLGWIFERKANLLYVIEMVINTVFTQTENYIKRAINGTYGGFEPPIILIFLVLFISIIIILNESQNYEVSVKDRVISIVTFILGCALIMAAFLFLYSYVHVTEIGYISGIQGRYFLPFVLWLPIGLSTKALKVIESKAKYLVSIEIIVVAWIILCDFSVLLRY